jgi:hypothetical protein
MDLIKLSPISAKANLAVSQVESLQFSIPRLRFLRVLLLFHLFLFRLCDHLLDPLLARVGLARGKLYVGLGHEPAKVSAGDKLA